MGDVPTRWGYAASVIIAGERKYGNKMPTDAELTTLKVPADVLKPLHVLTDAFAGKKQVSASTKFDP